MDDGDEWMLNLAYRGGYDLAWLEVERSRFSLDQMHGPSPARLLERLKDRAARELGRTDTCRERLEAILEGVTDAVEGRRPRW